MPRPRKFNPKIPAHIDQKAIPRGVYWDSTGNGRWYVLEHPRMPTKANHLLRYVRRMFAWGVQHGHCLSNPASRVAQAKERGKIKMPSPSSYARLTAFAGERGQRDAHTAGSVAPYLAHLMVIAYSCRLRGIEVVTLTEANATEEGILSKRRKGSRDNITRWSPTLREAWEALIQLRTNAEQRHRRPPQLHAFKRPMLVSQRGTALSKSGLDSAWQRLISLAREGDNPVLAEDEVFTLHGLKHRGITDSKDKSSGGHRTERMRQRYDHETPLVEPAELPAISAGNRKGAQRAPNFEDSTELNSGGEGATRPLQPDLHPRRRTSPTS